MIRLTATATAWGSKLAEALSTIYGCICAAIIFVGNFFSGYETAVVVVVVSVLLDTIWGIAASIKRGHFTLSALGREGAISKWLLYACVILVFILIERAAGIESHITVVLVCSLMTLTEVWSMTGNALIINPRMPFLRLFRKILIGEIAHKMGISTSEVEEFLKKEDEK